jgi:hypothetical protein
VFLIRNTTTSYPITLAAPYLSAYFLSNTFTQVLAHPSGWLYLYSDSNAQYSTASNYIYVMNTSATTLSNLSFLSVILLLKITF